MTAPVDDIITPDIGTNAATTTFPYGNMMGLATTRCWSLGVLDFLHFRKITYARIINVNSLFEQISHTCITTGPWFNIKISSYRYRKSHCEDETILRQSYLHNGICYTGKKTYLYWIRAQVFASHYLGFIHYKDAVLRVTGTTKHRNMVFILTWVLLHQQT